MLQVFSFEIYGSRETVLIVCCIYNRWLLKTVSSIRPGASSVESCLFKMMCKSEHVSCLDVLLKLITSDQAASLQRCILNHTTCHFVASFQTKMCMFSLTKMPVLVDFKLTEKKK